jgi:glycerol-3-phosphate acyltransferase PlsY
MGSGISAGEEIMREAGYVVLGYLVGSLVFGYLFALLKGRRDFGSEDLPGGAGTIRQLGWWLGVWAGPLDVCKAALIAWVGLLLDLHPAVVAGGCLAVMVGHNWPLYFRFKGGMGLSSAIGCMAVLTPVAMGWSLLAGIVAGFISHFTRFHKWLKLGNAIPVAGTVMLTTLIVLALVFGIRLEYLILVIAYFCISVVRSIQDLYFPSRNTG